MVVSKTVNFTSVAYSVLCRLSVTKSEADSTFGAITDSVPYDVCRDFHVAQCTVSLDPPTGGLSCF